MSDRQPSADLLRACARFELGEGDADRVRLAVDAIRDWTAVVQNAEDHGMAPLLRRHLRSAGVEVPVGAARQLSTLVVRHRRADQVRTAVLLEILDSLTGAGIDALVLKGAALAHALYPSPELRPMRDLDLLVAPGLGPRAQLVLRSCGFDAPLSALATRPDHHHLPAATLVRDGFRISVEIHEDVLSPDQPDRLTASTLQDPAAVISIGGRPCRTLGPADMLHHLCAHLLEPCDEVRLINVVDFVEYAARHAQLIDADAALPHRRRVANAVSLMHYLVPLPTALAHLQPPAGARPQGIGRGLPPLGAARARFGGIGRTARALLYPSEWWLHANYAVPASRPLTWARWGPHAAYLIRALWRRRPSSGR